MYKPTQALKKIQGMTKPIRAVRGGQGAGKTISIEMLMMGSAQLAPLKCTIFQSELTKLRKTAMRDFFDIMKKNKMWNERNWRAGENMYHFPNNGGYLEFAGLDKVDVGKGFRRDIIYFNELNRGGITLDTFTQLQSRAKITYADYNPDTSFWFDEEIIPDDDCETLTLTFQDNQFLPETEVKAILRYLDRGFYDTTLLGEELFKPTNIKNSYWANKWRVYGLGLIGRLEGVVFNNWRECHRVPPTAKYLCSGMDFGYTNDPTTIIDMFEYNGNIIFDEVAYQTGLSLSNIAKYSKQEFVRNIYCDPSRPDTRDELRRYGISVNSATGGRDSVNYGIELIQELPVFYVTKRSHNTKKELRNYKWKENKQGDTTNEPMDNFNHSMDAIRYCAVTKLKKGIGKYDVR